MEAGSTTIEQQDQIQLDFESAEAGQSYAGLDAEVMAAYRARQEDEKHESGEKTIAPASAEDGYLSSLEELETLQNLDPEQWHEDTISDEISGHRLERSTGEWVYGFGEAKQSLSGQVETSGDPAALVEHQRIVEELFAQGYAIQELLDEQTGEAVIVLYHADERGWISYESLRQSPEKFADSDDSGTEPVAFSFQEDSTSFYENLDESTLEPEIMLDLNAVLVTQETVTGTETQIRAPREWISFTETTAELTQNQPDIAAAVEPATAPGIDRQAAAQSLSDPKEVPHIAAREKDGIGIVNFEAGAEQSPFESTREAIEAGVSKENLVNVSKPERSAIAIMTELSGPIAKVVEALNPLQPIAVSEAPNSFIEKAFVTPTFEIPDAPAITIKHITAPLVSKDTVSRKQPPQKLERRPVAVHVSPAADAVTPTKEAVRIVREKPDAVVTGKADIPETAVTEISTDRIAADNAPERATFIAITPVWITVPENDRGIMETSKDQIANAAGKQETSLPEAVGITLSQPADTIIAKAIPAVTGKIFRMASQPTAREPETIIAEAETLIAEVEETVVHQAPIEQDFNVLLPKDQVAKPDTKESDYTPRHTPARTVGISQSFKIPNLKTGNPVPTNGRILAFKSPLASGIETQQPRLRSRKAEQPAGPDLNRPARVIRFPNSEQRLNRESLRPGQANPQTATAALGRDETETPDRKQALALTLAA